MGNINICTLQKPEFFGRHQGALKHIYATVWDHWGLQAGKVHSFLGRSSLFFHTVLCPCQHVPDKQALAVSIRAVKQFISVLQSLYLDQMILMPRSNASYLLSLSSNMPVNSEHNIISLSPSFSSLVYSFQITMNESILTSWSQIASNNGWTVAAKTNEKRDEK